MSYAQIDSSSMTNNSSDTINAQGAAFLKSYNRVQLDLTADSQEYLEQERSLSMRIVPDPSDSMQIVINIAIINKCQELENKKDSSIYDTFTELKKELTAAYASSKLFREHFPLAPSHFQIMLDSAHSLARLHKQVIDALRDYQLALMRHDGNQEKYREATRRYNRALNLRTDSYQKTYETYLGEGMDELVEKFKDKYR